MKRLIAYGAASFTLGTGITALLSYCFDIPWMGTWHTDSPRMAINTAMAFISIAIAVCFWPRNGKPTKPND